MHAPIHKGSNLGTGLRKFAGNCYNIQKLIPARSPTKTQQDSRKDQFNGLNGLNWLRNVIKCTLDYILEPIKRTKTSVFCYAVTFRSGIGLGSAIVCHDKTTNKLSLTSFKV